MRRKHQPRKPAEGNAVPTLVSTLLYETIRTYKDAANGKLPTSVYVNKIPFLVTVELAEEGVTVPVPYAWYRFGPEVETSLAQVRYLVAPKDEPESDEDPRQFEPEYRTLVDWKGSTPDRFEGDSDAVAIRNKVIELVHNYIGPDKSELLVDRAYEHAPFEFQRLFRLARIKIGRTGRGSAFSKTAQNADLATLVRDAFEKFPEDVFPGLNDAALTTRRIVGYAWNRIERRDMFAAADAIEQFWSMFASFLRTVSEGRSPWVQPEVVDDWKELAQRDAVRSRKALGDLAIRLSREDPDVRKDNVLGLVAELREAERNEADRAIDDALADAADLEAILSEQRTGTTGG